MSWDDIVFLMAFLGGPILCIVLVLVVVFASVYYFAFKQSNSLKKNQHGTSEDNDYRDPKI